MTKGASTIEPVAGLCIGRAEELRYDGHVYDPLEVSGLICKFVPPGSRVLDVGCGTGSVTCILIDRNGVEVVGVEPSAARAEIARSRGVEVTTGFYTEELARSLPKVDVVLFADVLEHLADPSEAITAAKQSLTPGGLVVASVPNVAHWSVRWDLLWGRFNYETCGIMDATHLRWFTLASFRRFLTDNGLAVEQVDFTTNYTLPVYATRIPWKWMSRNFRDRIIRMGRRLFPTLFGCQIVVKAKLRATGPDAN